MENQTKRILFIQEKDKEEHHPKAILIEIPIEVTMEQLHADEKRWIERIGDSNTFEYEIISFGHKLDYVQNDYDEIYYTTV